MATLCARCGGFWSAAGARRHRTGCAAGVPWRRAAQLLSNIAPLLSESRETLGFARRCCCRCRCRCRVSIAFHRVGKRKRKRKRKKREGKKERKKTLRFPFRGTRDITVSSGEGEGEGEGRGQGEPGSLGRLVDNSFAGVEKCVAGGMTARAAGGERSS